MKKLFAVFMSVVSALTVLCASASAATLGNSVANVNDSNLAVSTGDSSTTLIIIVAAVAVVALAVIIISVIASKKNKK